MSHLPPQLNMEELSQLGTLVVIHATEQATEMWIFDGPELLKGTLHRHLSSFIPVINSTLAERTDSTWILAELVDVLLDQLWEIHLGCERVDEQKSLLNFSVFVLSMKR